ncbi:MAG: hypothetical protein AAF467_19395 [Actinomycetota bacterium]
MTSSRPRWGLAIAVAFGAAAYLGLVLLDRSAATLRDEHVPTTIAWWLLAWAGFAIAVAVNERRAVSLRLLWTVAIASRVVLWLTEPTLSDDVYRYLWDGHLITEGVNPYRFAVSDPRLDEWAVPIRDLVNAPTFATPYLPVTELVFAAVAAVAPLQATSMQVTMTGFDLATIGVLLAALPRAGLPRRRVLLYAWNPLVVIEVAHGAHLDALMTFLAVSAIALADNRRWWAAPALAAAAVLTRGLPALFLPLVVWRWRVRHWLVAAAVTLALSAPFAAGAGLGLDPDDGPVGLLGSARVYARDWQFNAEVFHWFQTVARWIGLSDPAAAGRTSVGVVMVGIVLASMWWLRPRADEARGDGTPSPSPERLLREWRMAAVLLAAYAVLTTTLHPWYLVAAWAVAPFVTPTASESPRRWWLLAPAGYLSAMIVTSYLTYLDPNAHAELAWVRRLEWYPTLLLAAAVTAMATLNGRGTPGLDGTEAGRVDG